MTNNSFIEVKFLIKFITSDLGKIISSRIKEHRIDQALCALNCKRLAWTDFLIQFKKTFFIICRSILCETCKDLRLFAKQINDLCIGTNTKCTDQYSDRNLTGSVHTHIEYIVGVSLIFQPCSSVRNYCTGKQSLTDFIVCNGIIDSRGTY